MNSQTVNQKNKTTQIGYSKEVKNDTAALFSNASVHKHESMDRTKSSKKATAKWQARCKLEKWACCGSNKNQA